MGSGSGSGAAECCYDLPSSPALLPNGEGSKNSCPLSIGESARVRAISAIHISIQQRQSCSVHCTKQTHADIEHTKAISLAKCLVLDAVLGRRINERSTIACLTAKHPTRKERTKVRSLLRGDR
jgi:hypothetical protein